MSNDERDTSTALVAEPVNAIEAQSRADFDIQIATAKRYPMHSDACGLERFKNEAIAMVCIDQETAESCIFSLPRDGKIIQGRSIRFAEICASAYGNVKYAYRVIEIGEKWVTVQGVCHDLERNVSASVDVQRRITTKYGKRYSDDMIIVTCNATGSIAVRNAIGKVVPSGLTQPVYEQARLKAVGGIETLEMRRPKALRRFGLIGIEEARVLKRLGHQAVSDITLDDLTALIGLYNAIKAGEVTPDEAFPPVKPPPPEAPKDAFGVNGQPATPPPEAPPEPQTAPEPEPEAPAAQEIPCEEPPVEVGTAALSPIASNIGWGEEVLRKAILLDGTYKVGQHLGLTRPEIDERIAKAEDAAASTAAGV